MTDPNKFVMRFFKRAKRTKPRKKQINKTKKEQAKP